MPSRLTLLILAAAVGSACGTKPPVSGPPGPEICTNKTDDNGDGKVDCADPRCFQDAACRGMTERCDNDIDDNGDGLADCKDPLCAGQACGFDCTCIGGIKVMGTTGGGSGGANGGGAGGGTGGSSGGGTGGSGGGTGGSVGGGTGGSIGGGTGGSSGGGTGGSSGGGTGGSSGGGTGGSSGGGTGGSSGGGSGGSSGGGTGGANGGGTGGGGVARELNCADNIDNDGDNATDCDDTDCVGITCGMGCTCALHRKTEVNCTDGADNDSDGKADCLDSDCVGAGAEICGDGIDNNCDNAIDCGDTKCTGSGLCNGLQDAKPCLWDTQCAGGKCYTELATGTPNGACGNSVSCTVGTANVGCNGGTCVAGSTFNTCYAKCTGTGISGTGACRAGYLCIDADTITTNNNNYCMPSCSSSAECLNQGGVYGCNPWNKRCGTIDRNRGKYGAPCTQGADCEGGVCYVGTNFPGGYCGGYCRGDTLNCATGGICNFDSSYGDNLGICYESCTTSPQCRTLDRYHCFGPASNPVGTCLCVSAGYAALGASYCCSGSWNSSSLLCN